MALADGKPKILVIEDDTDERELLGALLSAQGFVLSLAASVTEALAAFGANHFCMVLADYNLPDGTGTGLLREAKRRGLLNGAVLYLCTAEMFAKPDAGVGLLRKPIDLRALMLAANAARGGLAY
jgi:DNA-binding response OmpR family regulator